MATPTPRLVSGSRLGRYRLERLLGTGGMASVWQARDERLGRTVAVKVLSETLALDRDFVRRFNREAKIAARLSHPNLVEVFEFGAGEERPYLVSEFVAGGTLAQRLEAGGRPDAERLARELLSALAHIHSAGVVHRDVKPANVLLDREGRARLTDFGVAQPGDATGFTQTGGVIGTRGYMAPEIEAGERATERSDLYSVGVLLEEVVARSPAPGLVSLIRRLKAEDAWARPRSAAEALRELETLPAPTDPAPATAVIAPEPAPPTDLMPTSPRRFRRRNQRALAVLGVLALGALSAAAILESLGGGDDPAQGDAAAGADRAKRQEPEPNGRSRRQDDVAARQDDSEALAAPVEASPAPTPAPAVADPCAAIEQRFGFEFSDTRGFGHIDKAIRDAFKARGPALYEQLKGCQQARGFGGGNEGGGLGGEGFGEEGD